MIDGDRSRAQSSLPALALSLLILSSVTVLSLAVADGAFSAAERDAGERHVASSVADRLVDASGPLTVRQNVLNGTGIDDLDANGLRNELGVIDDEAVRFSIDGDPVVSEPDARGGTTVRRIVSVRRTEQRSITPALGPNRAITLPRRSEELAIELHPSNGTTIHAVSANDRVLLWNRSGLDGEYEVELSRFETARLRFAGSGPLHEGNVTVEYPVEQTNRATLAVTVDG